MAASLHLAAGSPPLNALLPTAAPTDEMSRLLNPLQRPEFLATATNGSGVFDTLKAIAKLVLQDLKKGAGG